MVYTNDDKWLVDGLEKGAEAAYEKLFMTYYTPLVVFAQKILVDEDLAREVVQDVFVMFYEKREVLNIHSSLKSHLYQSVRNRCLNQIKRNQIRRDHHSNIFLERKNEASFVEEKMMETELEARIYSVVKSLPQQCRRIFEMSRFEGVSNQEIADQLKLSKRTVETQISKALKSLRQHLKDYVTVIVIVGIVIWKLLF